MVVTQCDDQNIPLVLDGCEDDSIGSRGGLPPYNSTCGGVEDTGCWEQGGDIENGDELDFGAKATTSLVMGYNSGINGEDNGGQAGVCRSLMAWQSWSCHELS